MEVASAKPWRWVPGCICFVPKPEQAEQGTGQQRVLQENGDSYVSVSIPNLRLVPSLFLTTLPRLLLRQFRAERVLTIGDKGPVSLRIDEGLYSLCLHPRIFGLHVVVASMRSQENVAG